MTEDSISTLALALSMAPGILHSVEVVYPMWVRWLANYVLPLFEPGWPKASKHLNADDQTAMLEAALMVAPKEKKTAAEDYIFVLLFEQRQGALAFILQHSWRHLRPAATLGRSRCSSPFTTGDVRIVHAGQCQSGRPSFFW